jgi:hypothetical protein
MERPTVYRRRARFSKYWVCLSISIMLLGYKISSGQAIAHQGYSLGHLRPRFKVPPQGIAKVSPASRGTLPLGVPVGLQNIIQGDNAFQGLPVDSTGDG